METPWDLERLAEAEIRLSYFLADQIKNATTYFGYPEVPENNDLSILGISSLAKLHLNNAGDPWVHGNAKMHTKEFEQEALDFVASLYDIKDNYWGYVTSGGTEGNLYGMYTNREYFSSQKKKPVFLYSDSSHYSIPKNAHLLGLTSRIIRTSTSGEMDYSHFHETIERLLDSEKEAVAFIINLNIGTTMTGAMDDIAKIKRCLADLKVPQSQFLIHADAALMGFIYPFLDSKEPLFKQGISSIAISGHKFPGAIHPCGIVLTKKDIHTIAFGDQWVPYVGTQDTTISGSRNGFLALNLWYIFQKKGVQGFKKEGEQCIANAQYLARRLTAMKYPEVGYFPDQIIVTFKKPNKAIVSKYQLATSGDIAHIVVMQHITPSRIDAFCEALQKSLVT